MNAWLDRWWRPLLLLSAALHVASLFGDVPEPDAALYANISRVMAESGDFVNLLAYNVDWLDKPHFPFWVTALGFKLFGVSAVTSRLPALGFIFLGAFSTWRLGKKLHSENVARLAVLVLLTSQHLVMSSGDVRAEPFLVGLLTTAVFHTVCAREEKWLLHVVLASVFTAAAMMTKGPFLLFPVACVAVLPALVRREPLLLGRWLLAVSLVLVFLLPELISLWLQFDSHPEKLIFDRHGVSGLRWFFWDSQFGRFTNSGPIRGQGDPSFFFHTALWSFLPWSFALYAAAISRLRAMKAKAPPTKDPYSWSAALPTLLLFSASRFQLPHYLNILFPFFALIVAAWWFEVTTARRWAWLQGLVAVLMTAFAVLLVTSFGVPNLPGVLALLAVAALAFGATFRTASMGDAVGRSVGAAAVLNLTLVLSFNPAVRRYEVGREAAEFANTLPPMQTVMLELNSQPFAFHLTGRALWFTRDDLRSTSGPVRVLTSASQVQSLKDEGFQVTELRGFDFFHTSMLSRPFLSAQTRPGVLERWLLAEVSKAP